jgi:hypothetical protein
MVSRTERYLAKAAQCESAATSAADSAMMALYLELARQWRQLANQVETLDRERRWSSSGIG